MRQEELKRLCFQVGLIISLISTTSGTQPLNRVTISDTSMQNDDAGSSKPAANNLNVTLINKNWKENSENGSFPKSGKIKRNLDPTYRLRKRDNTLTDKPEKRLRLGVFMDEAAYNRIAPFFNGNDDQISQLLVTILNQIQAVYLQESLGVRLALNVVHLEILKSQPDSLIFENHETFHVLTKFCDYQKKRNTVEENHPRHWDMALYFTGLDLYTQNNKRRSYSSMGLAVIDGICKPSHSCVVGELGVRSSSQDRPYLSSGFMTAFVMAHEMGHNMGMLHDGYGNDCPKDGFLMSSSRGISGETVWSKCSAESFRNLNVPCIKEFDENEYRMFKFDTLPGQTWTADDQCKFFLKDHAAKHNASTKDLCASVSCVSPNLVDHYAAGPALDGTFCGTKSWCRNGQCTEWKLGTKPTKIIKGGWNKWTTQRCTSGCLVNSTGLVKRTRKCNYPNKSCSGKEVLFEICNSSKICPERKSNVNYANERCQEISKLMPNLTSEGNQMPYNENRLWQSCAIYCRSMGGIWYTPRFDVPGGRIIDVHLPDGSWCHHKQGLDYFCVEQRCISIEQIGRTPRRPQKQDYKVANASEIPTV